VCSVVRFTRAQDIWMVRTEFWLRKFLTYPEVYAAAKVEVFIAVERGWSEEGERAIDRRSVVVLISHGDCFVGPSSVQQTDQAFCLDLPRCGQCRPLR
jgi:hypothetical protein